jgi:hypothetical protein
LNRVNPENTDQPSGAESNEPPPVEIRPLTKEEYLDTIRGQLTSVMALNDGVADVWAYVYQAGPDVQITPLVFYNRIIKDVFRTPDGRYDQVLIPSAVPNVFVAVIVDRKKEKVHGHYILDFNPPPPWM